jgi:hypothetical protein
MRPHKSFLYHLLVEADNFPAELIVVLLQSLAMLLQILVKLPQRLTAPL